MPLLSSLMGKSYLGIDIGTTSIKAVEILQDKKSPKIINYAILEKNGYLDRSNDIIQSSSLKISEKETTELLKTLLAQAKFKTQNVIASLPTYSAFVTLLEIPQMSEGDIAKAMQFQINQHIPLPITEVTIDWIKVGEQTMPDGSSRQLIFLISVPNEQITRYQNIFSAAGLKLKALEIESLSLIRSLIGNDPTTTLVVDIGNYSTNILISDKGYLKHSAQTDFAGIALTKSISTGLGIGIRRAEEIKIQKGILADNGDYELSTLISPFLDAILNEIARAKNNFEQARGGKVERMILTGGVSNMAGLEHYVERQLGIPVAVGNPLLGMSYSSEIEPIARELGTKLSVAIGLAIRTV